MLPPIPTVTIEEIPFVVGGGSKPHQSNPSPPTEAHKGDTKMAERQSAVMKHFHDKAEKEKNYKSKHDVDRIHHIAAALFYMRDYPQNATLAADLGKEIKAMTMKQAEQDAKDAEEEQKSLAEAQAADAKAVESQSSPPPRAPSAPNLSDTRRSI
jgi:hypothetical protein